MKERPILFSAPMVRAIQNGTKTQTRMVVKKAVFVLGVGHVLKGSDDIREWPQFCPYGKPGDRLWVKESCIIWKGIGEGDVVYQDEDDYAGCIKDIGIDHRVKWKKIRPVHMPRWASRIDLEITGIRVERLQDISEEDAIAEGVEEFDGQFNDVEYCVQ